MENTNSLLADQKRELFSIIKAVAAVRNLDALFRRHLTDLAVKVGDYFQVLQEK